jgi:hypothetical protein
MISTAAASAGCRLGGSNLGTLGRSPMRVLAMLALALLLAGCEGDRIKHGSMNERQAQPQSTVLTELSCSGRS